MVPSRSRIRIDVARTREPVLMSVIGAVIPFPTVADNPSSQAA